MILAHTQRRTMGNQEVGGETVKQVTPAFLLLAPPSNGGYNKQIFQVKNNKINEQENKQPNNNSGPTGPWHCALRNTTRDFCLPTTDCNIREGSGNFAGAFPEGRSSLLTLSSNPGAN